MIERNNVVIIFSSIYTCMLSLTLYSLSLELLECNNKIGLGTLQNIYPKKKKKDLQKFFLFIE